MFEENALKYIPWERCTKRSLEIAGSRVDARWTEGENGQLRVEKGKREEVAEWNTVLQLQFVLERRGLAMEMADLMSWEAHEKLRQDLMNALAKTPPPGFQRLSMTQVKRADQAAFSLLRKRTETGVRPEAGVRPLDMAIDGVIAHRDYNNELIPLQEKRSFPHESHAASSQQSKKTKMAEPRGKGKGKGKGRGKWSENNFAPPAEPPAVMSGTKSDSSRRKGNRNAPKGLRGPDCNSNAADGRSKCYGFNLGTCKDAQPGQRCPKGWHICMKASCERDHAYTEHHGY